MCAVCVCFVLCELAGGVGCVEGGPCKKCFSWSSLSELWCLSLCRYPLHLTLHLPPPLPPYMCHHPPDLVLATDFGLAVNHLLERPVTRLGTLDYMAPEVCMYVCKYIYRGAGCSAC